MLIESEFYEACARKQKKMPHPCVNCAKSSIPNMEKMKKKKFKKNLQKKIFTDAEAF